MGGGATVRALAGGTFSRPQREGAAADPAFAGKPAEQFTMAHAHDGRRDFRRANRIVIQNRLSSRRHRRPADAVMQIISPINDSATPLWLTSNGLNPVLPPRAENRSGLNPSVH